MKKNKESRFLTTLLLCILCFLLGGATVLITVNAVLGESGRTLLQADRAIERNFVGEYDKTLHRQAVLNEMVDSLGDRWSYYLTPEEYEAVAEARANSYVGIGVTVRQAESGTGIEVLTVLPGSPAEEAGIEVGDTILSVEGTEITEENYEDCVEAIKGEEGTSVSLGILRTSGEEVTLSVERRTVQGVSAEGEMLDEKTGYIRIYNFYTGTAEQVKAALTELNNQGMQSLVLDVRNNPGGYVDELTGILDQLVPEGRIFISRDAKGNEEVYTADSEYLDIPIAILVNADSYSAAEFLAAQLRESVGAAVVGEQTCGKGFSQQLFNLPDGSAMGLSTAKYFTGSGESLIGKGLTPDPAVSLTEEQSVALLSGTLSHGEDPQLQAAVAALS